MFSCARRPTTSFRFILLTAIVASCDAGDTGIEPRNRLANTEEEAVEECPVQDPKCKVDTLGLEGRNFVYRVLTHINRSAGSICSSYWDALDDAFLNNAVKQWDSVYYAKDKNGVVGVMLGDMHVKGDSLGQIHLWSGLWDGRATQMFPSRTPEKTGIHEAGHRHYYRMGDYSLRHMEINDAIEQCYTSNPM